jgi:hypothetical protein
MSGVPGKSRRCSRKRYPNRWANFRTTISGREFFGPIRAIRADRAGDTGSETSFLFIPFLLVRFVPAKLCGTCYFALRISQGVEKSLWQLKAAFFSTLDKTI